VENEKIRALSNLSQALWSEPGRAQKTTCEILEVVSQQDIPAEMALDRATQILLHRAEKDGVSATIKSIANPFFRLSALERFVLSCLHKESWSYLRISQLLDLTAYQIERMAWGARMHLANLPSSHYWPTFHPTGSKVEGGTCPDYNFSAPWTQRFLDEEYGKKEKIFLQNHIVNCKDCYRSLARARDLYYRVESMIPGFRNKTEEVNYLKAISNTWKSNKPDSLPLWEHFYYSLKIFVKKTDVQITLALLGILIFVLIRKLVS